MTAAILMTYRESSPERRKNLMTTLQWLAQEVPEVRVLVVEQDRYPHLQSAFAHSTHQTVFAYNPHGFNKSWGYNVAVNMAQPSIAVFTDADLIVAGRVRSLIQACEQRAPVAKPYTEVIDLTPQESELFHQGNFGFQPPPRPATPSMTNDRKASGEHLVLAGGMFAIRADAFFHLGGWDERFVGWGGEDDAMSVKIQRSGMQVAVQKGAAAHLWHPRATDSLDNERYRQNLVVLERIKNVSNQQLQRMAEVQRQVIGAREKYRPMESQQ